MIGNGGGSVKKRRHGSSINAASSTNIRCGGGREVLEGFDRTNRGKEGRNNGNHWFGDRCSRLSATRKNIT